MDNDKPAPETIVEGMIDVMSKHYSYLAIKQDEFEQAKSILRSGSKKINDYSELTKLAVEAFSCLDDGHVRVVDEQGNQHSKYKDAPRNFDYGVAEKYLTEIQKSGPITISKLDDIMYLRINSFCNTTNKHFEWLYSQDISKHRKFIIDLRANGGGSEPLGIPLVSSMSGPEENIITSYTRRRTDENDPSKLSDFRPRYMLPNVSSFKRDVVVLTGAKTYSSAEGITMHLAAIPGTILIGDVTGGGSGNPQPYLVDGPNIGQKMPYDAKPKDLHANFAMTIPSWLSYRLDQVLLQNNGIRPHILIESKDSIVDNRDLVLERAIDFHRNGYIAR